MRGQSVLISGLGIAGPTLASWLLHHGFHPTVIERSPEPRRGGYIIDFWGLGYDVVERMGLVEQLKAAGCQIIARIALGNSLVDRLQLPDYG